ncbi:amidohydrolase family protein [Marinilabilia rubra]|uniref:Amidohydrolase n=1 Tax=Marinilabilia rubra TaxID=2162893 RepID=A0A2U2B740_9BACT|nr:amidohydrolase family protein [Marinilabilia rubra]PWD98853.1 amidohydrolase [Marinilabilia rubra]
MKIFKWIVKIALVIIGVIFLVVVSVLAIDQYQTRYLKNRNKDLANAGTCLVTHVNVIPMTSDTILMDQMVYIREGKIEAIGEAIDVQNVKVVEGKNKYLLPGLIDMHVHLWDRYELGLYLANGVTAIRNVWGMPMHLRIKEAVSNNKIYSPSFFTTGPKLTGPEFIGSDNLQIFAPEEGRERVRSYKKRGYDFIKTYYGLPKDIFDAVIDQAAISGMDIVAHPSNKVPYTYHFNSQIASIEHAEDIVQRALDYKLDTLKLNQLANEFADSPHTSMCPTLMAFYNIYNMLEDDEILSDSMVQYMNPAIKMLDSHTQFDRWHNAKMEDTAVVSRIKNQHEFHLLAIRKLHDAGVNIVCGTDAGIGITVPGYSIHQELSFYRQAGLSNFEVLKAATINAAKTHKIINNMGSIEKGKIANLILVDNNPLIDPGVLKKPDMVFVNGRGLDRYTLNSFEEKSRNRNGLLATLIRFVENSVVEK